MNKKSQYKENYLPMRLYNSFNKIPKHKKTKILYKLYYYFSPMWEVTYILRKCKKKKSILITKKESINFDTVNHAKCHREKMCTHNIFKNHQGLKHGEIIKVSMDFLSYFPLVSKHQLLVNNQSNASTKSSRKETECLEIEWRCHYSDDAGGVVNNILCLISSWETLDYLSDLCQCRSQTLPW